MTARSRSQRHGSSHAQLRHAIAALSGRPHRALRPHREEAAELRASARWLREESVQGIGIARRTTGDDRLPELSLTVFVNEKRPLGELENPVPEKIRIPGLDAPVLTDVVAVGTLRLHAAVSRPAAPGAGISRVAAGSGTLGCITRHDPDDGSAYVLTAGHVLTSVGCARGDHVLQPGSDHAGTDPDCMLAQLTDWITPKLSETDYPNIADAAIARVLNRDDVSVAIPYIGRPRGRTDSVSIDDAIQMNGFTSGYRTGAVTALDFCVAFDVELPDGSRGRAGYSSLVLCTHYANEGDSGAAILNMDRKVVGVHLGGSDTVSYFCRIGYVCDALGVEVLTTG